MGRRGKERREGEKREGGKVKGAIGEERKQERKGNEVK